MTTIRARVPESLYKQVAELAHQEKVSIDQLVAIALSAQVSSWLTRDSMKARARRGNGKKFDRVFRKVRDVEPAKNDRA